MTHVISNCQESFKQHQKQGLESNANMLPISLKVYLKLKGK